MSAPGKVWNASSKQWVSVSMAASADLDRNWMPAHNGLRAATFDLAHASSLLTLAGGFVWVARMWIPETITVTSFELGIAVAGSGLTAGQNFAGIYSSTGILIAKTADLSATWNSTGMKSPSLTAETGQSLTIAGGPGVWIYGAFLSNGSTQPSPLMLPAPSTASALNHKLTAATGYRGAFGGSGLTALPATLPTLTTHQYPFFMGLA